MAKYDVVNDNQSHADIGPPTNKKKFDLSKIAGLKPLILIFVLLIVALILYNSTKKVVSTTTTTSASTYNTTLQYIKQLEEKLETVVGSIKGSGSVKVMISIDSSPELEVAENIEEKTVENVSGTTTTKSVDTIIVNNNPLILKETLPKISGVIVVSSGASDIRVRLDIMNAVSTALGVSNQIVEVFVGE